MQDLIVTFRGLLVVALAELKLAHIEVAVSGKFRVRVVLEVIGKFLRGQIVVVPVVIPQRIVVEHIGRGCGRHCLLLIRLLG